MTVIVKRIGESMAIVIPKAMAKKLALTEAMTLEVSADALGIRMRKQGRQPRRPLSQIVAQIKPTSYRRRSSELADRPVGKEVW